MKTLLSAILGMTVLMVLAAGADAGASAAEKQKIEALIRHVAALKDAVFVRNGKEYDAGTAAKFLRRKWSSLGAEIKTADDFIDKAASVSSVSGKDYLVRFKGGTEEKSGPYLRATLKRLESRP